MKKLLFLFAALAICLVSCDPPEPELSDYTSKENSFVAMLNYLPYKANQSYTFVHDEDNTQWTFKPYSGGIYGNEFPVGISDIDGSVSLINTVLAPKGKMCADYYDWCA